MPIAWLTGSPVGLVEPHAVAYSEKEDVSNDVQCSVKLRCPWGDRIATLENILNNLLEWPYMPSGNEIRASSGSINPVPQSATTADGSGNSYPEAEITVNFTRGGGNGGGPGDETDAIFYETIQGNGEFIKISPKSDTTDFGKGVQVFFWGDEPIGEDAVTEEEAPTKLIMGFDYVVKYLRLTSIPAVALTLIDNCNDASVSSPSLGLTFAAETLLYNAPMITRTVTADPGQNYFDMECRWSWRKNGWNKFWRAKTQSWSSQWYYDYDTSTATQYKNFPPVSMAGMLP